jgi:hypothetical protein|uniref:Uncharacterized protein n=1 Tax=virus sp. ctE0n6 TaxID=2827985 RepID=A0A8S5RG56_9VIRU|nr:MAG TPA: hypothetical protein [virus sp. ctE0n6]
MKTIINKIVSFILALGVIIGAFEIYNRYIEPKAQTEFEVTNILYESTNDFYLEPNEVALILNNNDYIIINTETNKGYYNNESDIDISTLDINNYGSTGWHKYRINNQ